MRKIIPIAAAVAAGGLATPAFAADLWLDSDHTAYSGDYAVGASLTFTVAGVNVRVTGWSLDSLGVLHQASLGVWDQGLGVKYGNPDNSHTVDNYASRDFVLIQFDKAVQVDLAQFNTGWHSMNDTDATIGFGTLSFASVPAWNNQPQAQLNVLSQYGSGGAGVSGNSLRDINPNNVTGNAWLIGAAFANPDSNYDGFKIEKLTVAAVPEPSTWAMLLLGFFGLGGVMRARRGRRSAGETLSAARA